MRTYSEELKKQVVAEYLSGVKTTSSILSPHGIPRSNLYRRLKVYAPDKDERSGMELSYRNFYQRGLRIKRLEAIISILKPTNISRKERASHQSFTMSFFQLIHSAGSSSLMSHLPAFVDPSRVSIPS